MNRYLAVALVPLSWLPAQDPPPQFDPKAVSMMRARGEGIAELRAVWPQTGIGRLFADPDIEAMVAKYTAWANRDYARRTVTLETAARLKMHLEPHEARNMFNVPSPLGELNAPLAEMQRVDFYATLSMINGSRRANLTTVVSCLPQFEGRWTHAFEREAATLRSASWSEEQEAVKVGSFDAYQFAPPAAAMEELGQRGEGYRKWMMHLPGTFVTGTGKPEDIGTVEMSPKKVEPGFFLSLSIQENLKQLRLDDSLSAVGGLEGLKSMQWHNYFVGENIVEDVVLELLEGEKPTGLVAALLEGGGKLVPQALPRGALAQLRFTLGYESLMAAIYELAGRDLIIPEALRADARIALDGSVSLGVCAPKGGMIPQVFLTLGIADPEALDRIIAGSMAGGFPVKDVTYGGVACKLVKFPGMPAGIQPGFCRVGNVLHIAESGLSLRALLKAQKDGVEAMDVGDAALPSVPGDVVPTFDARFDLPLIYRNYYQKWLPLFEMTAVSERPLTRQDMPDPDVVDEHLGAVRGVGFRDGNRYVMRHAGTVGPVLGGYLMAWPPMGAREMRNPSTARALGMIARHKMRAAWSSLQKFEQREGRLPRDLAELFVAEKLAADALLMPMDELAETVALPNGKLLQSSFRYYPNGVNVEVAGNNRSALMLEIGRRAFGRGVLTADGIARALYGKVSTRAIDEFGK